MGEDVAKCKRIINKLLQDKTLKELFGVPGFRCAPLPKFELAMQRTRCVLAVDAEKWRCQDYYAVRMGFNLR